MKCISFALLILLSIISNTRADDRVPAGTVIIDAAKFIDQFPKGDTIAEAHQPDIPWLFDNLAIVLKCTSPCSAMADIPEDGEYHLFVRSSGTSASAFHVTVDGKTSDQTFGQSPLQFQNGGSFNFKKGSIEIRVADIKPGPMFDLIVLSKNPNLTADDLKPAQFPAEVAMLKDYKIPRADGVKFGDIAGDGRMGFVVLTPNYSAFAYDNGGKELWHWDAPTAGTVQRSQFEAPGLVWDFDHDGRAEFVHWRMIDQKEYLVMADGKTGDIKYKVEWPTAPWPHVYNNFRLAVARLHPGDPDDVVSYTDSGGTITINAYGPDLKPIWSNTYSKLKDYFGHYIYPMDVAGAGTDQIYLAHLCLDANGKEIWNNFTRFPDNHDHVDSMRFADLLGDGRTEMITGQSDVGTSIFDAKTGELLWTRFANHNQKIEEGNFLANHPGPQVVAGCRIFGNRSAGAPYLNSLLRWFDPKGNQLMMWPPNPINGNPNFVKGDWYGTGKPELFWYRFHLNPTGRGTLFFGEEVFHMFDFIGNGSDQVITLNNNAGILRVYGYKDIKPRPAKRDPDYLKNHVANHSHY